VRVAPTPTTVAAPAAASLAATGLGNGAQALGAMSVMIFNRQLVVTTAAGRGGVVTIVARAGGRLLGSCSDVTPGGVGVTCRLPLRGTKRNARIAVTARLSSGHRVLGARRISGVAVPIMRMASLLPRLKGGSSATAFICSPELRVGGLAAIAALP
jgi:hypothetical protein